MNITLDELEFAFRGPYKYCEGLDIKGIRIKMKKATHEILATINENLPDTQNQQLTFSLLEKKTKCLIKHNLTSYKNFPIRSIQTMSIEVVMINSNKFPQSLEIEIDKMPLNLHPGKTYQLNILHNYERHTFHTSLVQKVHLVMTQEVLPKSPESQRTERELWLHCEKAKLLLAEENLKVAGLNYHLTLDFMNHASADARVLWSHSAAVAATIFKEAFQAVATQKKRLAAFSAA